MSTTAGDRAIADRRSYSAGTVLFRQGEAGDVAYMIESGSVRLVQEVDGHPVELAVLGPGGIFGEMAVIDPAPRMATAEVVRNAVLVRIPAAAFQAHLKTLDNFMHGVIRVLINHLRTAHRVHGAAAGTGAAEGTGATTEDTVAALVRHTHDVVRRIDPETENPEITARLEELERVVTGLRDALAREPDHAGGSA